MVSNACAELFNERRNDMESSLEETIRSKRRFKRAVIVFAVVEFIVMAVGMFYYVNK